MDTTGCNCFKNRTYLRAQKKTDMTNKETISLFKGYADTCPTETTWENVVELIRNNAAVAEHTGLHRRYLQEGKSPAAAREKSSCPCFAVAVRFEGGKRREHISGWTSLCLADFDHIAPERMADCLQLIRQDPHTLLAYVTISGAGIRVVSRYAVGNGGIAGNEQASYSLAFRQMNEYYRTLTGLDYDEKCKNCTRLSGLAHDPQVYHNPQAVPFEVDGGGILTARKRTEHRTERRLKRVVAESERQLAEEGVAYEAHHRNEYIMRMGYLMNAYGVELSDATQWAMQQFADYDGDVAGIFRSCYRQVDEHDSRRLPARGEGKSREGGWAGVADIEEFLSGQGEFRKNTVTGKCEFAPADTGRFEELTDRTASTLYGRMDKEGKRLRMTDLHAVLLSDFVPLYNPFRHYLEGLPAWDGATDHIGILSSGVHVKEDGALFTTCFKKWLVAMVALLLDDEVVNHEILVLVGRQGIYKTTWLNHLLPPALRNYFCLKINSSQVNRDDTLKLSEMAVVCLEELEEMNDRELSQLKALTTMRHVNERAAYARFKEVRPHIASFCGTSNHVHILTDLSGNRRWMPFDVESIDSPFEHPVDYEGVYAQAYALARNGFAYWLNEAEMEELNRHNRHFEVPCMEEELIQAYYRRPLEGEEAIFVTNSQILQRINAGLRQKLSPVKIGIVMKRLGYELVRVAGKRGYRVVELKGEEIYRNQKAMARYC